MLEPLYLLVDYLVLLYLKVGLSSQLFHVQLGQGHYLSFSMIGRNVPLDDAAPVYIAKPFVSLQLS